MPSRPSFALLVAVLFFSACETPSPTPSPEPDPSPSMTSRLYVGTGTGDDTGGIFSFTFDAASATLTPAHDPVAIMNPTYITLSPDQRFLYSVGETREGSVSAYQIDPATGALTLLNTQSVHGAAPCYISTDATGRWVLVANYVSGNVASFPVQADGSLGEAVEVVQHEGTLGTHTQRQEAPHAHYIRMDPQNRFALATDLGIDEVRAYPLDLETGSLNADSAAVYTAAPGSGPRHLDFHPNGRFVYLVGELTGTVSALTYDAETGTLSEVQTVSSLPDGFAGTNTSADVHVHPNGRFLYVSNRGDSDNLAIYTINEATGELTLVGHQGEDVVWPRNFAIDPSGAFLLVANRRADEITVLRIDTATGLLTPTGQRVSVPGPTCIQFVTP